MSEQNFFFESYQDVSSMKTYLNALIDGIAKNKLTLTTEGEELILYPNGMLKLTIKARKKNEKSRLSIKIAWTEERYKTGQNKTIKISS